MVDEEFLFLPLHESGRARRSFSPLTRWCCWWGSLVSPGAKRAYDAWRGFLSTPFSIGFHVVALPIVAYHSLTWFQVMPKTAPQLPIDPQSIVRGGLAASAVLSVLILATLLWVTQ